MTAASTPTVRLVAGCMTGTSLDGLDAAIVRLTGRGCGIAAELLRADSTPLGDLAEPLRGLAGGEPATAHQIAHLALELGRLHARAVARLARADPLDFIAIHGQTVFHQPPASWQLINPWPVAHALNRPVVYDLRGADLARGGQGAPITPIADALLFTLPDRPVVVCNLGGFCNITALAPCRSLEHREASLAEVRAADVCPCNHVLDAVARAALGTPFDRDGAAASAGTPHRPAVERLADLLHNRSHPPRSLGTGDERFAEAVRLAADLPPADACATACAAVARAIAAGTLAVAPRGGELLLAGGGVKNRALVARLSEAWPGPVAATDSRGVPAPYREAVAMAVLGALCADGVPITLPGVTGAQPPAPIAGAWLRL